MTPDTATETQPAVVMPPGAHDERTSRREDFVEGALLLLADGQEWHFRQPVLRFHRDDCHLSGFQVRLSLPGDKRFAELMARRRVVIEAESEQGATIADIVGIELAIAEMLLLANYSLSPEQVCDLIQFSYDDENDPEGSAIRDGCMEIAEGRGKKRTPGS
jgi:hypothetical protein